MATAGTGGAFACAHNIPDSLANATFAWTTTLVHVAPTAKSPTIRPPDVDDSGPSDHVDSDATGADARWLDHTEMHAWRSYVETVGALTTALEADLAPTGLTLGDYQVLVYLAEAGDQRMRMCDLATVLQLSPSGLTRRLDGLVTTGLVAREGSPHDRRVMLAVLTDAGHDRLRAAAPVHVASVRRRMIDRLTTQQLEALGDTFDRIRSGLDDCDG